MSTKVCSLCGTEADESVKFCPECGSQNFYIAGAALSDHSCPSCGHAWQLPAGSESLFCPRCGADLRKPQIAPVHVQVVDEVSVICPYCKAKTSVQSGSAGARCGSCGASIDASQAQSVSPFVRNWKTSVGASVGGLFVYMALTTIIEILSAPSEEAAFFGMLIYLAFLIISIWYSLSYYPSLFDASKARSQSSGAISFANCFVGGLLGLLWNTCLTKGKLGVSHIVNAVCCGLVVLLVITVFLGALGGY